MKRSALSLALLIATFALTTSPAHAQPNPRQSPVLLAGDEACGTGNILDDGVSTLDAAGWCPSRYNGLSDWLAARAPSAALGGDGLSTFSSNLDDEGESGAAATEPESPGALPVATEAPRPQPAEAQSPPEPTAVPVEAALPPSPADPAPQATPSPLPAVAPPRPAIPSGLAPKYPNVLYLYYDVMGCTYNDVQEQASNNGPVDGRGEHWAGTTNWSMTWKARAMPDGRLADVEVSYAAKITLPRWAPPADATDADVEQWNEYLGKLAGHENEHVEILVSSIPRVAGALKSANKDNVQAVFDAEFKRISHQQDEYDAATNHGLN